MPDPARTLSGAQTSPLIDPHGATFVYRGAADAVRLRTWRHQAPGSQPFVRHGDSDPWSLRVELPTASRLEYKLEVETAGHVEWILDPLNPLTASDPFGANSVCRGHGYERPVWTLPGSEAARGQVETISVRSEVFGSSREIGLYMPARYDAREAYPLLVVHDGFDYLAYASLGLVLDNLIHAGSIPPVVAALTQSRDRLHEYAADCAHATFVARELPAAVGERVKLQPPPRRVLMGASFGAVASLHAAWMHAGAYGGLVLQSGSFVTGDLRGHEPESVFASAADFLDRVRAQPGRPAGSIYISCGRFESLLEGNRDLAGVLASSGLDVRYEEANDGHHWENWRDRLQSALHWTLGRGPSRDERTPAPR